MRGVAGGRCHPLIIQKYITCHLQYDIMITILQKVDKERKLIAIKQPTLNPFPQPPITLSPNPVDLLLTKNIAKINKM